MLQILTRSTTDDRFLKQERLIRKAVKSDERLQDVLVQYDLFYDDLIYLSWEETKQKYLQQVGR